MNRTRLTLLCGAAVIVVVAVLLIARGDDDPARAEVPSRPPMTAAQANPTTLVTTGTLVHVPDSGAARRRLGFVNLDALAGADVPVPAGDVIDAILGSSEAESAPDAGTVVRVGRRVAPVDPNARPDVNAIKGEAISAAQSCLGETLAQTILGPDTMGRDAALGVGLAESGDSPAGIQLRICGAPRYIRHIDAMEQALKDRFGRTGAGDRAAVIGPNELGEREIVAATIAADEVPADELVDLLAAKRPLRSLAWR